MATKAGNSEASSASSASDTVSLRVFSQLPEPNSTILFTSLPLSTQVAELKGQIRERIDSKPSLSDQRLIYRGRLLMKDTDTLRQVFNAEDVKSSQPLTLHLVVRDRNVNPGTGQAPSTSNQQPTSTPPPLPETTRSQQTAMGNAPNATQTQVHQPPIPNIHQNLRPQNQPVGFNGQHNHVQVHMPQVVPPGGAHSMHPTFPVQPFQQQLPGGFTIMHTAQGPRFITPDGQVINPPFPNMNMVNNIPGFPPGTQPFNVPLPGGVPPPQHPTHPVHPAGSQNINSASTSEQTYAQPGSEQTHRNLWRGEGVGQNGQRWTMTVNSNFPIPAVIHNIPPPRPGQNNPLHQSGLAPEARNLLSSTTIQQNYELFLALESLIRARDQLYAIGRHYTEEMNSIRIRSPQFIAEHIAGNIAATIQTRNRAQNIVNRAIETGSQGIETLQALGTTVEILQSLESEFLHVSANLLADIGPLVRWANPPPGTLLPPPPSQGHDEQRQRRVSGYLLYSPDGPQSLILDSEGMLVPSTTTQRQTTAQHPALARILEQMDRTTLQNNRVGDEMDRMMAQARRNNTGNRQPNDVGNDHNNIGNVPPNQAPQAVADGDMNRAGFPPGQNQANHVANIDMGILVPILRALWILVRVAGFIWFFSSGSMTRRSWLLCLSAVIVFAAQAAMVRTQLDRVRQYFEDILAGPDGQRHQEDNNNAARNQQPNQNNTDPNAAPNDGTPQDRQRRRTHPTPEVTAERLLREARQTQQGRLQELLRAIERAVILFVGSLYPGVGERQIQARERLLREQEQREAQAALPAPNVDDSEHARTAPTTPTGTSNDAAPSEQPPTSNNPSAASGSASGSTSASATREDSSAASGASTSADPVSGNNNPEGLRQRTVDGASSSAAS